MKQITKYGGSSLTFFLYYFFGSNKLFVCVFLFLLLIHEINEIARATQCFTLPCHSTQGRFDFTNIIIEKEIC